MKVAPRFGTGITSGLLWPAARRLLAEPLERLVHVARALAAGDSSIRTRIESAPAEIMELADAFDRMAESIEERERVLEHSGRELLETTARLSESEKMEAVGLLAGGVAHDFNNVLTVLRGSLELIEEDPLTADQKELVADALAAAERAEALTHRLLSYSRKQRLAPRAVDLNKLVTGMRPLLASTLGEGSRVWFRLSVDAPRVVADSVELETVLLNLAVNAAEAMPTGGRLTIRTGFENGTRLGLPLERYAFLSVGDRGVGMTRDVIARASEPFFTTKDRGRSTGLGLSGAVGFAKQSGGDLVIESAPGEGTTVHIYLPPADR